METSRGRWFLGEYAKRNRNADTAMVLDAVARMEATLATQKQPVAAGLADTLPAIRALVAEAKLGASAIMTGQPVEEALTPARKGARVIRDIAWTLRECGADVRICDLLDSQVGAIDAGCERLAAPDQRDAVLMVFDRLEQEIDELASSNAPGAPAGAEAARGAPLSQNNAAAEAVSMATAPALISSEQSAIEQQAAETPVSSDINDSLASAIQPAVLEPEPVAALVGIARQGETAMAAEIPISAQPGLIAQTSDATAPPAAISLGASLISNGIVQRPELTRADPLAAIRRMTQSEKIAFFS